MMQKIIDKLNTDFSLQQGDNVLCFKNTEADIPHIEINNAFASARISLQGAHILSWKPHNEDEVIWLSEDATFAREKSVRGGIPLCWPWFGAADFKRETTIPLPAHGFARTVFWKVVDTAQLESGETQVTFQLDTTTLSINTEEMWPTATLATYRVVIGETLSLELTTLNNSSETFTLGQALHTYFNVEDISEVTVQGLENKDYLDKTDAFNRYSQTTPLSISGEVDRIYLDTGDRVNIENNKRKIVIETQGSHSTVVWNPGEEVADKMGDLGEQGYKAMLCVESANAAEDTVEIAPGDSHQLHVNYRLERK